MNIRSFRRVFKNTLMVDLEYRFNYYMLLLSSVITVIMEWAIFSHVYEGRDAIGGLPKESAFAFVLYGMFLRTTQVLWGIVMESIDEIREGSFRRYLLQPIYHPLYFLAQVIGSKITPLIISIIGCVVFKFFLDAPPTFLSAEAILPALVSFLMSSLLLWSVYLMILYASFFIEESSFLQISLNIGIGIFSGTVLPLTWFPELFQNIVAYTPLPLLGDWPLRSALSLIETQEWLQFFCSCCLWIVCAFIGIYFLQRQGLRRYEAFGG